MPSHHRQSGYLTPVLRTPAGVRERIYVGCPHDSMFQNLTGRWLRLEVLALAVSLFLGLGFLGWCWLSHHHRRTSSVARSDKGLVAAGATASHVQMPPPILAASGALTCAVTRIEIWKGERRLLVYAGGRPVKAFRVALGAESVGPKTREGDGRTPEGTYYICTRNPNGRYGPALGISYPNPDDAQKALAAGVIGEVDGEAIAEAARRRTQPPWNTALGGSLFIQGNHAKSDWTRGSVALEDAANRELYKWTADGVPVVIHP